MSMMKNYSLSNEVKKVANGKLLVELYSNNWKMRIAYILGFDGKYLVYAAVSPQVTLEEVAIIPYSSVIMIKTSGLYLDKFAKKMINDDPYQEAKKLVSEVKNPTFDGFISAFTDKKKLVEIDYDSSDRFGCRVIASDETSVVIDEYYSEQSVCYARAIIQKDRINRIAINVDWVNVTEEFLGDK